MSDFCHAAGCECQECTFEHARAGYERHTVATAAQLIAVKQALDAPKRPSSEDQEIFDRILKGAYEACGITELARQEPLKTNDYIFSNGRPKGLDSPLAMQVAIEAEIEAVKKKIAEAQTRSFGVSRAFECSVRGCHADGHDVVENSMAMHAEHGLSGSHIRVCLAHMPKGDPKRLAGHLKSIEAEFRTDDQVDALKEAMGLTKPGTIFGLNRSEHSVRLSAEKYQGPRRPAMPGPQQTARPRVSYRVYDNQWRDDVLIVAESNENHGWGRMVVVSGQAMACFKSRTNAPPGEVALTDDDLETIIEYMANKGAMHFQPWTPVDDGGEDIEETEELQRELFFSDPVLREHVGRAVDINPKLFMNEEHAAAFQKGLERAWELAWGGPTQTVESIALARACDRCDVIMNNRKGE